MTEPVAAGRIALTQRGLWLNYLTIGYNTVEAVLSVAGLVAGWRALAGFGVDCAIAVMASIAAQWRLRAERDVEGSERVEHQAHRIVGVSFLALAGYLAIESGAALWQHRRPDPTALSVILSVLSVLILSTLARAKQRVARGLESRVLEAEAQQTFIWAYLSTVGLAGVVLHTYFDWWWASPIAALAMVPVVVREGLAGMRGGSRLASVPGEQ